jgi:hypothetical protein
VQLLHSAAVHHLALLLRLRLLRLSLLLLPGLLRLLSLRLLLLQGLALTTAAALNLQRAAAPLRCRRLDAAPRSAARPAIRRRSRSRRLAAWPPGRRGVHPGAAQQRAQPAGAPHRLLGARQRRGAEGGGADQLQRHVRRLDKRCARTQEGRGLGEC